MKNKYIVKDLGLIEYSLAYQKQKECLSQVIAGGKDTLLICEHPNVLTLGRLGKATNILNKQNIIPVIEVDRGGDVTLHSPGQIVIYPVFNLKHFKKDIRLYVNILEQVAIDFLGEFGISACRKPDEIGIYVENNKIASIGIGIKKWVAYHGISININNNINLFSDIRPCGLDVGMVSLSKLLARDITVDSIKVKIINIFERLFDLESVRINENI